ncbi:MAG TPA: PAS domain S-box protein [Candidatus Limnocylindrales bacterium]|nr:PAS domain S-box protein [Candidatus Limnocylindrales bacterium]
MADEHVDELAEIAHALGDGMLAFEHAPVGMYMIMPNGLILKANRSLRALLGYEEGELVGRHVGELLDPGAAAEYAEQFPRLLSGDAASPESSFEVLRSDGSPVRVRGAATVSREDDGTARYVIGWVTPEP